MKLFLIRGHKIQFNRDVEMENGIYFRKVSFKSKLEPKEKYNGVLPQGTLGDFANVVSEKTLQLDIRVNDNSNCNDRVVRISGDPCLYEFCSAARKIGASVRAKLKIKNFGFDLINDTTRYRSEQVFTKDTQLSQLGNDKTFGFEWRGLYYSNLSTGNQGYWKNNAYDWNGELEIILNLVPTENPLLASPKLRNVIKTNNDLLTNGNGADLSIIPSNGKAVKCHRSFFLVHSSAFDSIIKGTFGDAKSNYLKMPELTEETVQALLDFMYLNDTTKAAKSCSVALELYMAAQKYEMAGLREAMKSILASKEDSWYNTEMLVKFYIYAKNSESEEDLKTRAVKLIKENGKTLGNSESLRQLFKDDPEGAMELFKLCFI